MAVTDPYYAARPRERLFVELVEGAVAPPAAATWIAAEDILNRAIDSAVSRRQAPAAALAEAAVRIQTLLDGAAAAAER
jgi:hypothetical protein